jgi:hypothetical protein
MKKIVTMCIVLFCIVGSVFSATENWASGGYETGRFFESNSDGSFSTMQSQGIGVSVFAFSKGSDSGIYVHDSFLVPLTGTKKQNGITTEIDYSDFDFISQVGIVIGPGFRYSISDQIHTYCGLGFSITQLAGYYENTTDVYSILGYTFGVGGEIGMKIDISDVFYLSVGAVGTYEFRNYTSISTLSESVSGWEDDYALFSARPYIMMGFNSFRNTDTLGKPDR